VGIVTSRGVGGAATDEVFARLEDACALGIHRHPMDRAVGWSDFRATARLAAVCREVAPDIVHGHGAKGAAYARLAAPRAGARAVYTPHGGSLHYSWGSPAGMVYLALERLLKGRTDGILFESDYARRTYEEKIGAMPCPHRVVYNGLHEEEFAPVPDAAHERDFVFIGEIRRLKGIDVLLEAVARMREGTRPSVLMVGAGPDEARLRSRIGDLGLGDSITLSPPIHPARSAFALGRCVVAPSLAESLPYIVLEVLAAGVPLLTTRVGGIPEIFGPHADVLLPPGDAVALTQAMEKFMNAPAAAREQAGVLRSHVQRHLTVSQMVDAIVDFYREVLRAVPSEAA